MDAALALPCAVALLIFTIALLRAELTQNDRLKYIAKPLASLSFIALAIACGALGSLYGQLILTALILCALGDLCLLPGGTGPWFRRGVMAFFAGHIVYLMATLSLWAMDAIAPGRLLALPLLFVVFTRMYQRLRGAKGDWLIESYTAVIIAMVIAAIVAGVKTGFWLPACAAGMFAVSDVFVGRNRMGPSSSGQFWIITPLYFTAQGLFALSIAFLP